MQRQQSLVWYRRDSSRTDRELGLGDRQRHRRHSEHCGCKRPHGYVFFALLPFLLYFGACLAIEIFVPLPFPDEVKIPVYMGGLFLMWFCYANWSQRQD